MSFNTSYSSAEGASQQIGHPCLLRGVSSRQTHSQNDPPLSAQPPSGFLFLHVATVIGNRSRKIRQRKAEAPPGTELKEMQEQISPSASSRLCGAGMPAVVWCSRIPGDCCSAPLHLGKPLWQHQHHQGHLPHPQAGHTATTLQSVVR